MNAFAIKIPSFWVFVGFAAITVILMFTTSCISYCFIRQVRKFHPEFWRSTLGNMPIWVARFAWVTPSRVMRIALHRNEPEVAATCMRYKGAFLGFLIASLAALGMTVLVLVAIAFAKK